MKLVQKRFLKDSREFEIIDDAVYVRIKGLLKEEKLTVGLSILNPEPAVNGSELVFYGRYKSEPLLSLFLNKPNTREFNAFVDTLKQRVSGEDNAFAGAESASPETSQPEAPGWNVYEEPPEFDEPDETRERISFQPVNAERVDADITMLKTYLDEGDIKPLLDSLETLKAEPQNEAAFRKVMDTYNDLGFNQGAVLTYAPYLKVLLSKSM
ncbi:MAG: hypothetical protein PVF75_06815 [Granulosicoccaceae bacterium]|jgi:hypothetical protein